LASRSKILYHNSGNEILSVVLSVLRIPVVAHKEGEYKTPVRVSGKGICDYETNLQIAVLKPQRELKNIT
jgi:hypothetical protein